ncbi:site-specific integrase [Bizionia sp. M204]|uniref:site-specific integrase n=1 Tax=Bizionia sp. M204 TaxID=2675331 RepID=UPI00204DB7F9|nr:site-specific integrase [Bizionia sp. M204]UPS92832.1 tyrosine-type recombinase/integrase [Bizionia sp. M204]
MTIKYFIRKGKGKYSSIYVRFFDSKRIDLTTTTGFKVKSDDWSVSKQRLKLKATPENIDFINNKLDKLEDYIADKYNVDYNNETYISKTWLKEALDKFANRATENNLHHIYFVDWVKKFVDEAHTRRHNGILIKPRSIKNYEATLSKLELFEKNKNYKYRFQDIDLKFHSDFIHYCETIGKLNSNSIGNLVNRIKTFCRNIEIESLPINPIYKHKNFYAPKNETHDTYLTDTEINTVFNHDFKESEKLDNARDLFIIGLRTGLRVSDILNLQQENIINNLINITTQKTNDNLTIPIHPQVREILAKRNGNLPRKISDQKFNKYIKEVCKEAKINDSTYGYVLDEETKRKKLDYYEKHKLVSSHTCRRSFATNLFLQGIEVRIIMKATGHKSTSQFMNYIKATQDEHIKKISEYWENQNKIDDDE